MAPPTRPVAKERGNAAAGPRRLPRHRPIDLAPLRGFESAARHLSFTRAAEEMHVTQSAMSRQVAALEADLGHRLFVRKTRALELTVAGATLLRSVHQALGILDRTVGDIRGRADAQRVVLTTYPSFASLWLVPRLAIFQRAQPGIELRINADERRLDLEAEGIDIALRRCPAQDAPGGATLLWDEDITPALSPELLNRHGGRLAAPADLLRLPLIEIDEDLPGETEGAWKLWFEFAGSELDPGATPPAIVFAYVDQSMHAAARGQGVVLARRPFRDDMVAEGQLVLPFPNLRRPTGYGTYLVVNRDAQARSAVRLLRDFLFEQFARKPTRRR
jgi:LysR family glycine cleavage system transcriptional activator